MRRPLSRDEIASLLVKLPGWDWHENTLTKVFPFRDYMTGVSFANQVAALAEEKDHHPEMTLAWRSVRVQFTTHDAGHRVTQRDFAMAQLVETLAHNLPSA